MWLYKWVQNQMEKTYLFLQDTYPRALFEKLLEPQNILEAKMDIQMDDGTTKQFIWRRSQHNNIKWPYKWGIRFHEDVSLDEVKSLSAWMSFKTCVIGLPLWWGKWWIIVDPKQLSHTELEKLSRAYIDQIREHIWPETDVPAPDVNTNGQIMAWMADQYAKHVWAWKPWVITGKPLSVWWSAGRGTATAQGGLYVLQTYLNNNDDSLQDKKIIIQWAGNAGLTFANLAIEQGAIIVGISDSKGWIYVGSGINIAVISQLKAERKSVTEYPWATILEHLDILDNTCDILVPAALENQITKDNAWWVQAKIILELANGPTTPEADEILYNAWVTVLPDILANAGGVTVSYFEQVQNNTNYYRPEKEVLNKLKPLMQDATVLTMGTATTYDVSLRDAAYIVSMDRLLEAMQVRGW